MWTTVGGSLFRRENIQCINNIDTKTCALSKKVHKQKKQNMLASTYWHSFFYYDWWIWVTVNCVANIVCFEYLRILFSRLCTFNAPYFTDTPHWPGFHSLKIPCVSYVHFSTQIVTFGYMFDFNCITQFRSGIVEVFWSLMITCELCSCYLLSNMDKRSWWCFVWKSWGQSGGPLN